MYGTIYLVGGWALPLWIVKVNWDDDIPNIWENKKRSKPPTSYITMERFTTFYRKIHYFDWAIFTSYVKLPDGIQWAKGNVQETMAPYHPNMGVSCRCSIHPSTTGIIAPAGNLIYECKWMKRYGPLAI